MFLILFYIYISNNFNCNSNLFLLSIFQTTNTLIYQFEYIFHNYYIYIKCDDNMVLFHNFIKDYHIYSDTIKYNLILFLNIIFSLILLHHIILIVSN